MADGVLAWSPRGRCGAILRSVVKATNCPLAGLAILTKPEVKYDVPPLEVLPEAIATLVLAYLTATNILFSVRFVNHAWRSLSYDNGLWKMMCQISEKLPARIDDDELWERVYIGNPHVPNDFNSIGDAMKFVSSLTSSQSGQGGYRIFVGKGTYRESFEVHRDVIVEATSSAIGDVVVDFSSKSANVSTLAINSGNAVFSGIMFRHECKGSDIWNGNSAITIQGSRAQATFVNCDISSESGRGVVATRGASIKFEGCTIHDSAATGIYVGGESTSGEAIGCIIKGNGKGGGRVLRGHSGVFVDRAKFNISRSTISGNFLTGVSIVGEGGFSVVEDSIIDGNATLPIDAGPRMLEMRGSNVMNSSRAHTL